MLSVLPLIELILGTSFLTFQLFQLENQVLSPHGYKSYKSNHPTKLTHEKRIEMKITNHKKGKLNGSSHFPIGSSRSLPHSHPDPVTSAPVVELAERRMRRRMRTRKLRMHEARKLDDFASPGNVGGLPETSMIPLCSSGFGVGCFGSQQTSNLWQGMPGALGIG